MRFEIQYHTLVVQKDIPKLPRGMRDRIKKAIEERLETYPELYGKPLRRALKGYRKLRVGDYRVVFRIEENRVKIFIIKHRSVVYEHATIRILSGWKY